MAERPISSVPSVKGNDADEETSFSSGEVQGQEQSEGPAGGAGGTRPDEGDPGGEVAGGGLESGREIAAENAPAAEAGASEISLDGDDIDVDDLIDGEGVDLSEDFFDDAADAEAFGEDEDDALGWAIGSELEFIDEGRTDDWDGPVGDGLDEEEGRGGFSVRPRPSEENPDSGTQD